MSGQWVDRWDTRIKRTVGNWRWWVAIPVAVPFFLLMVIVWQAKNALVTAHDVGADGFNALLDWVNQKRKWE